MTAKWTADYFVRAQEESEHRQGRSIAAQDDGRTGQGCKRRRTAALEALEARMTATGNDERAASSSSSLFSPRGLTSGLFNLLLLVQPSSSELSKLCGVSVVFGNLEGCRGMSHCPQLHRIGPEQGTCPAKQAVDIITRIVVHAVRKLGQSELCTTGFLAPYGHGDGCINIHASMYWYAA
jgi:hypothetical protein